MHPYGGEKNVRRNLFLYIIDGLSFVPAMALISVSTVIPFFLEQLEASTLQMAIVTSLALVCSFVTQPFFGAVATRAKKMHMTFGKILLLQRFVFFAFILSIPLFAGNYSLLIWMFIIFWGIFNLFAGSYSVFFIPLILKLLPPDKRGGLRGIGFAIGSGLGFLMAALIPVIHGRIAFPYDFVLIFSLGCMFLFVNAIVFVFMREHDDVEPRVPMSTIEFIKGIAATLKENRLFRTMVLMCMFLMLANSLLFLYTVYAMRVFDATSYHIATLTAMGVASGAVGFIVFGFIIDRFGPKYNVAIATVLITMAGALALITNSLVFLYVAWVFANLAATCYMSAVSLLLGDVAPSEKLPLYAGVLNIITLALSSVAVLTIAPAIERFGFSLLFITVLGCGVISFTLYFALFKKQLDAKQAHNIS